ncbi:MAG: hypothetical protein JWN02_1619 [Acidobacteria bacterium]|nr:hypothetical protein [Acidobacteriota bacterium]
MQTQPRATLPQATTPAQQPSQPDPQPSYPLTYQPQPRPANNAPVSPLVAAARHQPSQSPLLADVNSKIAEAQKYLNEGRILAARDIYLQMSQAPALSRAQTLAIAMGLSHTSAWRESSAVYQRVFPLQPGEEMHMFYEAVNRYERGDLATARELLTRAGSALPATREVSLYRTRILAQ